MTDKEQFETMRALIARIRQLGEESDEVCDGMAVILAKHETSDASCPPYADLVALAKGSV